jgi:hypothetical protein
MSAEFVKSLPKLGPRVRVAFRMIWLFIPVCLACLSFRIAGLRFRQARHRQERRPDSTACDLELLPSSEVINEEQRR